jgi:UDP-N-acetyl-D-glucosamine/UDP-N-acetyl-D-galactosamine dehydrogenase
LRNSKVPGILTELLQFGIQARITDPVADAKEAAHEYGLELIPLAEMTDLDAVILAVNHKQYLEMGAPKLLSAVKRGGVFIDVKSAIDPKDLPAGIRYWSL